MFLKLYFIALPVFLAIDALWLSTIAKTFYQKQIGFLMKSNVNYLAALIFYLLFIAGLVVFVIIPAIEKNSFKDLVFYSLLFGLVTYATYDLTNLATVKNWPLIVTIIDLIWGMSVSFLVSLATFLIANRLKLIK